MVGGHVLCDFSGQDNHLAQNQVKVVTVTKK